MADHHSTTESLFEVSRSVRIPDKMSILRRLMSNLMAVLLQTLCARLGIVTRRDLAQLCREASSFTMY